MRKGRRMRKRMGTGLEIGQTRIVMKMESWVICVCVVFFGTGLGRRTGNKGGTKAPSD